MPESKVWSEEEHLLRKLMSAINDAQAHITDFALWEKCHELSEAIRERLYWREIT